MDSKQFKEFAKAAVDYIADYIDTIEQRPVISDVQPGYLQKLIPLQLPSKGECWKGILEDVDKVITPGLTHWHSPHFHAYYPTANSYPGIVGELILSGLCMVSTDSFADNFYSLFENKIVDWLAKLINLPTYFLNSARGFGGGIIQNSASESTLLALITASKRKTKEGSLDLVAYTSEQSNSSVEKAGLLSSVTMRLLPTDDEGSLRGATLFNAVTKDLRLGLIPCCVIATLGTTGTCAFDNLEEIGEVCRQFNIWLHVDAAYAGSALCCPEYQNLLKGIEQVDSFNLNPSKWMLVNSDCSATWFKDTRLVENVFEKKGMEFWQIPDERRFRAIKLWLVLRTYGVQGVRQHIRKQIGLARFFADLIEKDKRFEVCKVSMGLVCFRLKGEDYRTQELLDKIKNRRKIFIMSYYLRKQLVARFVVCSRFTEENDVTFAWNEIQSQVV